MSPAAIHVTLQTTSDGVNNSQEQLTSLDWNNFVIAKNASVASVLPIGSPCTH